MPEHNIELVYFEGCPNAGRARAGRDVTGADGGNAAMACRSDGAPSADVIRRALV